MDKVGRSNHMPTLALILNIAQTIECSTAELEILRGFRIVALESPCGGGRARGTMFSRSCGCSAWLAFFHAAQAALAFRCPIGHVLAATARWNSRP